MWLISPLSWLLIAMLLLLASFRAAVWRRWALLGGIALAVLSIVAMTPLAANLLVGRLEHAEPVADSCKNDVPLIAVVLAGGVSGAAEGPGDLSVLELATRRRVDRSVAWWRAAPGRRLVLSGGSWFGDGISESTLMEAYARELGVPPAAILLDSNSLTTWESAQHLAQRRPALPTRVVLVTSAMHMPRAAFAMREAGFDVCPVPADSRKLPFQLPGYLIPRRSALEKTEASLHEIVGMAYYRWLSRQQAD